MNEDLIQFVKKYFPLPGKAYDLGYGNGEDIIRLKYDAWDVIGLDKKDGIDLENPLPETHDADLVYSNFCLQFINNKKTFMVSCNSLLKTGGYLFIQTMHPEDKVMKQYTVDPNELYDLIRNTGFELIQIHKFEKLDTDHDEPHTHVILEATAIKREDSDGNGVLATPYYKPLREQV